jgi:hypothetical protein
MINIRYHIISITAVFLALGIGLTLGSTFLDRATVENVKGQLDRVEARVQATDRRNQDLTRRLNRIEDRDLRLAEQLPEQLFAHRLDGVPILVIAAKGADDKVVARTVSALAGSGASVAGTWWITDRFVLDDDSEVRDLSTAVGVISKDATRLRRIVTIRLADILHSASALQPASSTPSTTPSGGIPGGSSTSPAATEPPLIAALRTSGFIEYQTLAGAPSDQVLLQPAGMRYVVISGSKTKVPDDAFLRPLLQELASQGPAAVLAAQGTTDANATDAERVSFVGPLRADDVIGIRISTVDDLESAAGLAAAVLALEDLAKLQVGHYGTSDTASRLLPAPEPTG